MGYDKRSIAFLPLLFAVLLTAQSGPSDAALASASELLAPSTSVLLDASGHLVFIHTDSYDVVRKDRIPMDALEVDAITLATSGMIHLACPEENARCAHSTLYRADQELRSSVLRIQAPRDSAQANAALAAIKALALRTDHVAQEH